MTTNKKANELRNSMTAEEVKIWFYCLKPLNLHFRRQKVIGKYIVDFYCASKKIVIEIDGSQHCTDDKQVESDKERDEYLKSRGITVLRYNNLQVNTQFKAVCDDIYLRLNGEKE